MSPASNWILLEYNERREFYEILGSVVQEAIEVKIKNCDIQVTSITHRVKSEESLKRKLILKDGKYETLNDITDILGVRIITMYSDEVDKVARLLETYFVVDRENTVDKRKTLGVREFGYQSLHYICSLPKDRNFPSNMTDKKFEIQIRTEMQHIWSEINHDIGYKSDFALPSSCMRSFSKLASLLEIADEIACNLRNEISDYVKDVRLKIANNTADNIEIDHVSILEYVKTNNHMKRFFEEISRKCGIEINHSTYDTQIFMEQLKWFGFKTLGDIQNLFERCHDVALKYAQYVFKPLKVETITSSVGLRFLFNAELIMKDYSFEKIMDFYKISINDFKRAKKRAENLIEFRKINENDIK